MKYFLDLFSPETYGALLKSEQNVSGFRIRQKIAAGRVDVGDRFLCYLTRLSRWAGILEVSSLAYEDSTPLFLSEDDPFIVRFKVKPLVLLDPEYAIPIHNDAIWNSLSFTKGQSKTSPTWTGKIRASLTPVEKHDASFLEEQILAQATNKKLFSLSDIDKKKLKQTTVRRLDKDVVVSVPDYANPETQPAIVPAEARESIKVQTLLAEIGSRMGHQIWIPRSDRGSVLNEWKGDHAPLLERLPLNYDEATLQTIENIDVLWLKGRSIRRAFEVEHTTSIYSGILRMADLLALQPNMDIRLHIVAPENRRDKVFSEIRRPVFSLLDRGPLSESCTYLSYEAVKALSQNPHLPHLSDSVLEEYEEPTDD